MHQKFLRYIYLPDFGNKFLVSNPYGALPRGSKVYFRYIFSNYTHYNPLAMKAIQAMESIYPLRCKSYSKIITVKYSNPRCHSVIYLGLDLPLFYEFFPLFVKKPITISSALTAYQKSSKYFIFPGFISQLFFPSWKRNVLMSFSVPKDQLLFLFQKSAFLD